MFIVKDMLKEHGDRLSQSENNILLLKGLNNVGGNDEDEEGKKGLLDALQIMVENLRKECYANFGSRYDTDYLKRKMEEVLDRLKEHDGKLNNFDISLT